MAKGERGWDVHDEAGFGGGIGVLGVRISFLVEDLRYLSLCI